MRFLILAVLLPTLCFGQDRYTPEDYISMYKDMAINEMHRSGVPASITLAQGILESGCGNSDLAKKAKNHFGVKGHRDWDGPCFYMDDDAKDECFRVYKSVAESFADHSEFLHSNTRYEFLFELRTTDYEGWARGLKKAGYATNPKYAELLINLIERYELYDYDTEKKQKLLARRTNQPEVFDINGIPAIAYDGEMTIRELRDNFYFAEWQLYKYNDLERSVPLKAGQILYLKPKKRRNKVFETHTVQEGENLQYIAQLRGIKLKRLRKLNLLEEGEEPAVGAVLSLNNKRAIKPKVSQDPVDQYVYFSLEDESELYVKQDKPVLTKNPEGKVADRHEVIRNDGLYHEVGPGESLMSIARAYEMDWKTLKLQNGLESNDLEVGQLLLIEKRMEMAIADSAATQNPNPVQEFLNAEYHVVEEGQSLFSISQLYGLSVAELMRMNDLREPRVDTGIKLRVSN